MSSRAAWAALIGVVVLSGIVSANLFSAVGSNEEKEVMAKPGAVSLSKYVLVKNDTPYTDASVVTSLDFCDFGIIHKIGDHCIDDDVLVRPKNEAGLQVVRSLREVKISREGVRQDTGGSPIGELVSRRIAGVHDDGPNVEFQVFISFLKDASIDEDGDVSPHLQGGALSNRFYVGFGSLYAKIDSLGDAFHGSRSPQRLGDRSLHIASLGSGIIGQQLQLALAGIPELVGGTSKRECEPSNGDGGECRYGDAKRVKNFANLNDDEWQQAIGGTGFLAGLCAFFAYLIMRGD